MPGHLSVCLFSFWTGVPELTETPGNLETFAALRHYSIQLSNFMLTWGSTRAFCHQRPKPLSDQLLPSFCLLLQCSNYRYVCTYQTTHVAAGDLNAGPYAVIASSYLLNSLQNLFLFEMGS